MRLFTLLSATAMFATMLSGQSLLNTTAGGDQVFNSYGLQTEFKWHRVVGWTGLGYNDGVKVGAYLQVPLTVAVGETKVGYHLGIGDQRISAFLDVDEDDSHSFTVRGVSLIHKSKSSVLTIFSGLLSQEQMLPYMHTGYTSGNGFLETPLGAVIYQRQLSETLQFHVLNLMSQKLTNIESLGWKPSKRWNFAGATGIGSGAKYLAGSGEFHNKFADIRTSYTIAGKDFQRQEQSYYSTELLGLNARLSVTPITAIQLTFDHERSQTYITGFPAVVGTFNSANLSASVLGLQLSPSVSTVVTDDLPGRTLTEIFSGSRQILPRWRAFGAYIHMDSPSFNQQTILATNEFRVSPRLAIRQNFNRTDGQNNFSFGGQWVSNLISVSVDQQVYVSPLAAAFGGKPIFQAWTFNIRMRAPHGTNVNLNTFVAPDSKVQWGGYLSGLRYDSVALAHSTSASFFKYRIHGMVVDENGNGVWGIAVRIDKDIVLSDEAGEFYLDVKNSKPMPLAVAAESCLQTSRWTLKSAPLNAVGSQESETGAPIQIVLQMARQVARK